MATAYLETTFYLSLYFTNPVPFLARLPFPVTRFLSIPIPAIGFSPVLVVEYIFLIWFFKYFYNI